MAKSPDEILGGSYSAIATSGIMKLPSMRIPYSIWYDQIQAINPDFRSARKLKMAGPNTIRLRMRRRRFIRKMFNFHPKSVKSTAEAAVLQRCRKARTIPAERNHINRK